MKRLNPGSRIMLEPLVQRRDLGQLSERNHSRLGHVTTPQTVYLLHATRRARPSHSPLSATLEMATISISPGEYSKLVRHVIQKMEKERDVEDEDLIGFRWNQLRDLIIDHVSDADQLNDESYLGEQKAFAATLLRRMVHVWIFFLSLGRSIDVFLESHIERTKTQRPRLLDGSPILQGRNYGRDPRAPDNSIYG